MQSAERPKPVAAMLATTALSVDALRRVAAVLDQTGGRVRLLPEIANRGSLQFVQKLVIVRRKKSFGRRRRGAGMLLRRWRQEGSESRFGAGQANPHAGHLSRNFRRERIRGRTPVSIIHLTNLNDPGPRNDHGEETMVTGMVTPAEPKDLDERKSETKNLLCKLAS